MNEYQKLAIRALNQMRGNNANSAEIEAAIYWVEQQKECEYEDEDFEDREEDTAPDLPPIPASSALYASGVRALCQGGANRAILLKEGYVFDAQHTEADVRPYQLLDGSSSVPVAFEPVNATTMGLRDIQFSHVTGDVSGCVVLNDAGLIAYLPVTARCDDSNLTITSTMSPD